MFGFIKRFLGDNNESEIRRMRGIVEKINALEPQMKQLSDGSLYGKTSDFKDRIANGESLDSILPEAFATVREASRRVLGMRHFDVQMIGGICLHEGKIAEMRTGEGKTLVATLAVYLNALTGKGVHMITVNDYLAKRDSEWMGRLYRSLGLTVGLITHDMDFPSRKFAYNCDITFGTNNEFGFDYLRDNMVVSKERMVQRELNYAIIDEVDSILIDEARTPLIISGPGAKSTDMYAIMAKAVANLKEGEDYVLNEKEKTVSPNDSAVAKVEKALNIKNLYDSANIEMSHCFTQALRAKAMMKRDRDYVVRDGEIVIVDEFTGRLMFGRRYSEGLHQAIEAKEGVKIQRESQTLATITFQNYFRMYEKLAGMTGTAKTEENEFLKIYKLPVIVVPTNKPIKRIDYPDVIYKTKKAKMKAVINTIKECHAKGQPVLVGTTSIVQSEEVSAMLKRQGIDHKVLNAKYHEMEAEIIKDAGQKGAVTIATNMAGRGTDISLGEGVAEVGGLYVIGTERHESRRIDNQLRGRSGRQGDPGQTQFCISMEDDLMRLFGGDRMQAIVQRLGVEEDEAIESGVVTRQIENAQKKVEGKNFSIRKYVLQYDNVMNKQREIIYGERKKVLFGEDLTEDLEAMTHELIDNVTDPVVMASKYPEEWDFESLNKGLKKIAPAFEDLVFDEETLADMDAESLKAGLYEDFADLYKAKEEEIGADKLREVERMILIRVVDNKWMDHIDAMDQLKSGIGLRGLGGQDPAAAYAQEGFDMFEMMINGIKEEFVKFCYNVTVQTTTQRKNVLGSGEGRKDEYEDEPMEAGGQQVPDQAAVPKREHKQETVRRDAPKVGRNDPCPCGSGKKYKHCCGRNQ